MIDSLISAWLADPALLPLSALQETYYGADSDEGGPWLWLIGPAGGLGFFMWVFLRYRNTDKRHAFERETATEVLDLRVHDQQTGRVTGVENSMITGHNSQSPLKRLGGRSTVTVEPAPTPPAAEPPQGTSGETPEPPAGAATRSD